MMKIAIIGFGVVGSGVAEVFYKNRASIERKAGRALDIQYILDLRSLAQTPYADKAAQSFEQILSDPEVGVVVETIGGLRPAFEFSKRSLEAGKHVITSNKELVATHGAELLKLAAEHQVNYLFEASVGGGIPI
ncbi:MAG: homoserine dehydrogenase, partial [Oscillospiraceae bacterium]